MKTLRTGLVMLIPVLAMGACTSLSAEDRALIDSASRNAATAQQMAQQAINTANAAQATANSAAQTAGKAAADAAAANEKADRMFQRSLRKP